MITQNMSTGVQVVEGIEPLKSGDSSPRGFDLYQITYLSGEWTVRNLKLDEDNVFVGSFTPNPEKFSL